MRVVAILNQKGGVGKTTTAVNLGAALARSGRRVLLIDIDPQANLTDHLGVDAAERGTTVYDVLTEGAPIPEALQATSTPGLFVLPADGDLAAAEQELATEIAREMRLRRALASLEAAAVPGEGFDWVLVDCPPSLGLLSLNAMAAADDVLVTVQTEYFAMRGLGQIDQIVAMVREHVNPRLRLLGILPTLVSHVTRLAREVVEEIRAHYGELVFATRIRQNVRLAEAPGHQVHIFDYDPQSAGAEDYAALAREVEARCRPQPAPPQAATGNGHHDAPKRAAETQTPEAHAPEVGPPDAGAQAPEVATPDAGGDAPTAADDEAAAGTADAPAAGLPVLEPVIPPVRPPPAGE